MKNFKEIKKSLDSHVVLERRETISARISDKRSAELLQKELTKFTSTTRGPKADVTMEKSGSHYVVSVTPKTSADDKIIRSFMDDAGIELLKNEFISSLRKNIIEEESFLFSTQSGEEVLVTPAIGRKIAEIHDILNDTNQEMFLEMVIYSKDTFNQATSFCESYSKIQE
jgi:hypothetical protein